MNFTRIARFCFSLLPFQRRVCLTFDGQGCLDDLRVVVKRLRRLGLLRFLLAAILTHDVIRLHRIFRLVTRRRIRIAFTAMNTVRIRFFRRGQEIAVLRVRVTFPVRRSSC